MPRKKQNKNTGDSSNKPARTAKGHFLPGNTEGVPFEKGNKAAEIWTEQTVTAKLLEMWDTLVLGHQEENGNYIRANDVKTIQEICLMHDVDPDMWAYFKEKFKNAPGVMRIIKKILWVLEARLIYSGQAVDIFVMKNHYGYSDKKESDITSGGKPIASVPLIQKIEIVHTDQKAVHDSSPDEDEEDTAADE